MSPRQDFTLTHHSASRRSPLQIQIAKTHLAYCPFRPLSAMKSHAYLSVLNGILVGIEFGEDLIRHGFQSTFGEN